MSTAKHKEVVRRFFEELWNDRNLAVADEIFSEDCVTHQLGPTADLSNERRDPDAVKKHVSEWLVGFPDLQFFVEQTVAENGHVATHCRMEGTHTGRWLGIPPSKKHVIIRMITIHRIEDGKIIEDWVLVDALGFFQQLGLVPPTEKVLSGRTT